jgi:hypothetical protein
VKTGDSYENPPSYRDRFDLVIYHDPAAGHPFGNTLYGAKCRRRKTQSADSLWLALKHGLARSDPRMRRRRDEVAPAGLHLLESFIGDASLLEDDIRHIARTDV